MGLRKKLTRLITRLLNGYYVFRLHLNKVRIQPFAADNATSNNKEIVKLLVKIINELKKKSKKS